MKEEFKNRLWEDDLKNRPMEDGLKNLRLSIISVFGVLSAHI
jgi:hypothetical protein